jgi:hypothetical protein
VPVVLLWPYGPTAGAGAKPAAGEGARSWPASTRRIVLKSSGLHSESARKGSDHTVGPHSQRHDQVSHLRSELQGGC